MVLPAAMWAEVDGTFTNYQRRVQRIRRAVPPPGDALPRWELAAGLLERLGAPLAATSAREVFARWLATPCPTTRASTTSALVPPAARARGGTAGSAAAQEARA